MFREILILFELEYELFCRVVIYLLYELYVVIINFIMVLSVICGLFSRNRNPNCLCRLYGETTKPIYFPICLVGQYKIELQNPNPNWGNPKTFSRSPSPTRRRRFFHARRSFPLVGAVDVLVFSLLPCFVAAVVALSCCSMNSRRNLVALLLFVAGGVAVVLLFSPVLSHLRRLETSRCPCSSLLLVEQR